ncbi:MAG: ester cyclase [Sporichthyaceae bacterium]
MHYNFGIEWLKAFRESSEKVCALYNRDGFVFEDVMLDQHNINDYDDLLRLFSLYANKDRANGFGVHNFKIRSYVGDKRSGLLRWEWTPEDAGMFIGLDVAGKPFGTQGHTFHIYNEAGKIVRESSWWDAAAILRAVGPVSPTKSLTGTKGSGTAGDGSKYTPAANDRAHAERWAAAVGSDIEALGHLYADYFTSEWTMVDDHLEDTATDREMLAASLGGLSSGENGTYTLTVTDVYSGNGHLLIHWDLTVEGASTYRGLPTGGKTLTTLGSTFHELDSDGKILLESTCIEDNRVFIQLGVPILRPHYWEADFDMAAFVASLGA